MGDAGRLLADEQDTIVAPASGPGPGAVAVIRISGGEAVDVLRRVAPDLQWLPRMMHVADLVEPATGLALDRGLVAVMPGPASYTGEDVVELFIHGGAPTVRAVLRACIVAGARAARPGEFTRRAFLNGKMDLPQAEAVATLVDARSERARQVALDQLSGRLSEYLGAVWDELIDTVAEVEARLDFPEEELPALSTTGVASRVARLRTRLSELLSGQDRARLLRDGARVVIVGPPNAGKSSLLNALLGQRRALVSATPGTTRDYIAERMRLDGLELELVDTAGVRRAGDEIEAAGVSLGLAQMEASDLVLVLLAEDAGLAGEADAVLRDDMVHALRRLRGAWAVVVNKIDRTRDGGRALAARSRELLGVEPLACVSALSGAGVDGLLDAVKAQLFDREDGAESERPLVIENRHYDRLAVAVGALEQGALLIAENAPEEVVALELRDVLGAVGEILGRSVGEEILDAVFTKFCIGK